MDRVPAAEQATWKSLFNSVNADTNAGVVASTHATRQRYWRHWGEFLPPGLNPNIQDLAPAERIALLQGFARRVREGTFGRGKQVKVGSVQTALGAVGKTIELDGFANPLHRPGTTNYPAALTMQMETYRREDPATDKQVAVPVSIPNFIFLDTRNSNDRRVKAIGELTLIAFYFLLRVGEYTYHGKGARRTQQFRLCDLKFFAKGHQIQPETLPKLAGMVDLVSMTIDNQKNGHRGQTLSHHALKDNNPCCAVHALVSRTIDLIQDGAQPETLICAFRESPQMAWQHVRSKDMVKAVKDAVRIKRTKDNGFDESKVGSHSLRAGGAMALYITKHSAIEIQRAGRWTSTTFMEYIHGQLDVVSKGLAQAMSQSVPFINMAR